MPPEPTGQGATEGAERRPQLPRGYRLAARGVVSSTNDEAKRLAALGEPDGTVVHAAAQSAGRGRGGRGWSSPPGNLYMSLLLRPACTASAAPQLGFAGALAAAEAIAALLPRGRAVGLKWPNDVLVGGGKAGGILLESSLRGAGPAVDWLVLGVGVNIASHPADLPYPATSLAAEGAAGAGAAEVLEAVVVRFAAWREIWQRDGFPPLREAWLRRGHGVGEPIRVRCGAAGATRTGRFGGLDEHGALLLDRPDGRREPLYLGDVYPLER